MTTAPDIFLSYNREFPIYATGSFGPRLAQTRNAAIRLS
jgi:hypothetical protein